MCQIIYILVTGSQRKRERENWLPFYVWVGGNKIKISPKWLQSEVSGLRGRQRIAIHPSPRRRHSITQALWTWIKCHLTPDCLSTSTSSCWHWPPRALRQLLLMGCAESQFNHSGSWRISQSELKAIYRVDDCTEPWQISGFSKCICTVASA